MSRSSQIVFVAALFFLITGSASFAHVSRWKHKEPAKKQPTQKIIKKKPMALSITSSAFKDQGFIPARFTCDGEGINPPLVFDGVPSGTRSLVLIMEDPDVPKSIRQDGMWDHWTVWNISPTTGAILENVPPGGVMGTNTGGDVGYFGPCPPDREHRYFFKLYALKTTLSLPQGSTKTEVLKAMKGTILAGAQLVGRYKRK